MHQTATGRYLFSLLYNTERIILEWWSSVLPVLSARPVLKQETSENKQESKNSGSSENRNEISAESKDFEGAVGEAIQSVSAPKPRASLQASFSNFLMRFFYLFLSY